MKRLSNDLFICIFIFAIAFAIRCAYVYQIRINPITEMVFALDDFDQYRFDNMAKVITSGQLLGGARAFIFEPFYPYFLAMVYKVFGHVHFYARLAQVLIGSCSCILLYYVAKKVFNRTVGILSALILATYGMAIFYDGVLLRENVIIFLTMLSVFLLLKAKQAGKGFYWFFSGVILGLSLITRQNMVFPFVLLWVFVIYRKDLLLTALQKCILLILGLLSVMTPVLIRNYLVADKLCIMSSTAGFWVGNTYDSPGVGLVWLDSYKKAVAETDGNYIKTVSYFFKETRNHPKEYFNLYLRKFKMFFNGFEVKDNLNYYVFKKFPTILRFPFFTFRAILPLAAIGLFLGLKNKNSLILYIYIAVLSFSVILFHITGRYRMISVPFFIIFASYSLFWFYSTVKNKQYSAAWIAGLICVILFILIRPDPTCSGWYKKSDFITIRDYAQLALAYIYNYNPEDINNRVILKMSESQRLALARNYCDIAFRDFPKNFAVYGLLHGIRGDIYLRQHKCIGAVEDYKRALIYDNKNKYVYNNIAIGYANLGHIKKSITFLKRALSLDSEYETAKNNLLKLSL